MAYTIKKVEKETKISAHTLRFWAKKGLFPFVQKDENSVKYFSKSDIEWAKWIEWLRNFRYANRTSQTLYKTLLFGYKNCQRETRDVKANKEKITKLD